MCLPQFIEGNFDAFEGAKRPFQNRSVSEDLSGPVAMTGRVGELSAESSVTAPEGAEVGDQSIPQK